MRGLEELIRAAMDLQQTEDDLQSCCHKPAHRAHYLSLAMVEAARTAHDQHSFTVGAYIAGEPWTFDNCPAYPCRMAREFGDLNHEH